MFLTKKYESTYIDGGHVRHVGVLGVGLGGLGWGEQSQSVGRM